MSEANRIRLIVSDIDGVWTDGRIVYGGENREFKSFNVRDGLGVKIAQMAGITVAVVTSRSSAALERRCRELGVVHLEQSSADKLATTQKIVEGLGLDNSQLCYIGDDLPDLAPMRVAAISAAPADAAAEVLRTVTWKLQTRGGEGAFRELVERLLKERGEWAEIVKGFDVGSFSSQKV